MEATDEPVPLHVLRPGRTRVYDGADDTTKRAGLGYAILRALGAHERLSLVALATIAKWSAKYGASHGGVTPDPMALRGQDFVQLVGRAWGADQAPSNAARYPGGAVDGTSTRRRSMTCGWTGAGRPGAALDQRV